MGGAVQGGQSAQFGNISPVAEANVLNDPEAAKLVFASFADITMAGLNVTGQLDAAVWRERLRGVNEAGRLLHAISENYVKVLKGWGNTTIPVHDPCAVLAVVRPELFTEKRHVCVDVETRGELTTGQTVADWKGHWKRAPQTTVLMRVDPERSLDFFLERISRLKFPDLGPLPAVQPEDTDRAAADRATSSSRGLRDTSHGDLCESRPPQ
eukprot:gnl/TRDRNA2_/TRDRNA2_126872_c0_seq1.p1 gnl/TRDRNA2_/TRDRNA2_126872_c0~~gnl/TRDRNA2_/TRDRNA2_126872_c0_seq1.p1  ORF type:complete len:211 (+),score=40.03 gnl/TRDRNA2_/TRDRNA2_126872_c0_seq1:556-1188(+)